MPQRIKSGTKAGTPGPRVKKIPDHPLVTAVIACVAAARDNDKRAASDGRCPTCGKAP